MGYRRQPPSYKLVFDDDEFDGLEVKVGSLSIGEMRDFIALMNHEDRGEVTEQIFDMFANCLLSWNLEDENDEPVPATLAGINSQDADFVMAMISAWIDTVTGVPDETPLPGPSSDGEPFPEASIPMETLPVSLAS